MRPPSELLAEALPLLALLGLLVVAYRHPRPAVEAGAAVVATGLALVSGLVPVEAAGAAVAELAPVVAFLATVLVVADVCERAGVFRAAARLLRPHAGARRLFTAAFLVAAAVTAVLSLDATVVLLTPVVLTAARGSRLAARPGAYACLRMANSASLLLPVSNLTNLLALPDLDLTFGGFALTMAPVLLAVLAVEYVGLRLLFRAELPAGTAPLRTEEGPVGRLVVVPAGVVVAMLVGFAATSPYDVAPAWISGVAAALLVAWARRRGLLRAPDAVRAAHLEFALFVLALGVVVAAISAGFLGSAVAGLVPSSTAFWSLLWIAVLATALANLVTNLSAALLLVPLVAPLGDVAVLAALLGLNIGSGLTLTGSLANLLWRRTVVREPDNAELGDLREFHRVSLRLTPVALLASVGVLSLVGSTLTSR